MTDAQDQTPNTDTGVQSGPEGKSRIDWDNPDTLAGDAPPMPRWPLMMSIVVYAGWLVFLVVMAYMRINTTAQ